MSALTAGIYDVLDGELEAVGLACECLGGGKVEHNNAQKTIVVFGESQVINCASNYCFWFLLCEDSGLQAWDSKSRYLFTIRKF